MDDLLNVPLPKIIFVSSSDRKASWELANQIADFRSEAVALSFEEPLRGGILGTFFQCDPSLDLSRDDIKLPLPRSFDPESPAMTGGAFRLWYHHALVSRFGKDVLGRIMLERLEGNKDYFDTFVFADGDDDLLADMSYIAKQFGLENCLMVRVVPDPLERKTFSFPEGVKTIRVSSSDVKPFLRALANSEPETAP